MSGAKRGALAVLLVGVVLHGCSEHTGTSVQALSSAQPNASPLTIRQSVACGSELRTWPEEGDDIVWTVSCGSAMTLSGPTPDGVTFDAASGAIAWKPRLDQAGPFSITLMDASGNNTHVWGTLLDRFDAVGDVPLVDRTNYLEEFALPVFHLTWHSTDPSYCLDAVDRDAVDADVIVGGHAHAGAQLRCRGATSLAYPKKSFTLKFSDDDPFQAPAGLAQFEGRKHLSLTQTFDDNSQIRNRLAFEVWNRLDSTHVRIDHASVVVYIDGEYHGLYELTDDIDDKLLGLRGFDDKGGLFKSVAANGDYKTTNLAGYEKDDGDPADDFTELTNLLTWISTSSEDEIEQTIDTTLRTNDFFDWYILTTSILGYDNYAKNSYVYQPSAGDLRFFYIPWDLNGSWGQWWDSSRLPPTLTGRDDSATLASNGIWQAIAASPTLLAGLDARFTAALAGPIEQGAILYLFDQMSTEVEASALRDDRKWDAARRAYPLWSTRKDFTTFATERTYVRSWIASRWSYLTPLYAAQ